MSRVRWEVWRATGRVEVTGFCRCAALRAATSIVCHNVRGRGAVGAPSRATCTRDGVVLCVGVPMLVSERHAHIHRRRW